MKKCLKWGLLAFLIFFLCTRPHRAADVVHAGFGGVTGAASSLSVFVSDLP
jgi:hypothetical protein